MKHIVLNKPYLYVGNSIPKEWKASMQLVDHKDWSNLKCDYMQDEFYVCNDFGYNTIAKSNKVPINRGFCKALSDLANDKYQARANMETMKSIQHVLCDDNIVNWPFNRSDCLFAKPVHGFAAQGTVRNARHGTVLPDIGEPYLIEKYIDDKYPRLSVDGYLCGDRIGILATCDNVYLPTQKIQYHYLGYPSKFWKCQLLEQRYKEVIQELQKITKCDNQIIGVEFFEIDGDFIPMEINPRILFNAVPLFETLSGVNPWEFMSSLLHGIVMHVPKSPPQTGIVRYSYELHSQPVYTQHNNDTFSIHMSDYSHTYSSCDRSKPHWELINEVDELVPTKYPTDKTVVEPLPPGSSSPG